MKRLPWFVVIAVVIVAGAALVVRAQAPAAQGGRGGGGGAQAPAATVNPSDTTNERSNLPIDQFVGSPLTSTGHLSHGGLLTRSILRNGSPYAPGPMGNVLEYRTQLAMATLQAKSGTPLMAINNQFLFYVVNGQGRLDDGK